MSLVQTVRGGAINLTNLPFEYDNPPPVYTFTWSNGESTEDISGLATGEYCVTVTEVVTGCITTSCFQVGSIGTGDFYVNFNMEAGCAPMVVGDITAVPDDPSLGPFEYIWTTYNWVTSTIEQIGNEQILTNVPLGWYDVVVTDAMGCTASNSALMWVPATPFTVVPTEDPIIVCPGQTEAAEIEVTYGAPPGPLTYSWVNYSEKPLTTINTGQQSILADISRGSWGVTVTNGEGCEAFTAFSVKKSVIEFESVVNVTCNEGSIQLTPETFKGSNPPYGYAWSDGATTEDRTGLEEGIYTVTIEDALGCLKVETFDIEHIDVGLLINAEIGDNGCGADYNGTIMLEVDPSVPIHYSNIQWADGTFWEPDERYYLSPGDYYVTITSDNGCEEEHTFTVGQAVGGPLDNEVEVLRYFGNEIGVSPSGNALVKIVSNQITPPGPIEVSSSIGIDPVIVTSFCNNGYSKVSIPILHKDVDPFYFKYTAYNECEYFGEFLGIDECEPNDGFNFDEIEHVGTIQGACGPGQEHTYKLHVNYIGDNFPYFIEVSMDPASNQFENGYKQIVEITNYTVGDPPIEISGIPAGKVKFKNYNFCHDHLNSSWHSNCCETFSCDIKNEGPSEEYDGSYYWDYPYFRLWAQKSLDCFDECGDFNEGECSRVTIQHGSLTSKFNCWTGTITITYGNGSTGVLEVLENGDQDKIEWKSGSKKWEPSNPGNYTININYVGSNGSANCNTSVEVDYHGPGHYNDVIGLRVCLEIEN